MLLEMLAQQQRVAQMGLITSGLAHDVKNHIFVLMGNADLALCSANPQEWRDALTRIKERCRELSDVTNAFLGFVRRNQTSASESFDVSQAVRQACSLAQPLARQVRVEIAGDVPTGFRVAGEPRLLIQALLNLISNALRAIDDDQGQITVSAIGLPGKATCRIEVRDTGPGIPEVIRRRLFRPFATGHPERGGTGMGLFIVRQAVRRLDGSIRVRTSPRGTQFQIDLPTV